MNRRRAVAGVLIGIVLATACESSGGPTRGVRPARDVETPTPPARGRLRWELAAQLSTLASARDIAASQHLDGRWRGVVLTSVPERYASRAGTIAEGAIVAEALTPPGEGERVILAMVKRAPGYFPQGGDWEYLVLSGDGMVEERGKLEGCARCHAEAPSDHLFRVPPAPTAPATSR